MNALLLRLEEKDRLILTPVLRDLGYRLFEGMPDDRFHFLTFEEPVHLIISGSNEMEKDSTQFSQWIRTLKKGLYPYYIIVRPSDNDKSESLILDEGVDEVVDINRQIEWIQARFAAITRFLVRAIGFQQDEVLTSCSYCKRIRDKKTGRWLDGIKYITDVLEFTVSHGICPTCYNELEYPHRKSS